jgi:polyhydroxyalkanoate synthesis repressor PhaR
VYFRSKEGESGRLATKKGTTLKPNQLCKLRVNQGTLIAPLCLECCIAADFSIAVPHQEFSLPAKSPSKSPAKSTSAEPSARKPAPGAVRTIKKYPNRRLYDTQTSSYVTLAEIKKLVMAVSPMVVLDAKTGEDLTRSILLQIILEEESAGVPMFSEAVLSNIIRFYGHAMQGHMGSYLESHVQSFMDWQSKLGESNPALTPEVWAQFMQWQTPLMHNMFSGLANPSQNVMAQMQDQMQKQIQKNTDQLLGVMGLRT